MANPNPTSSSPSSSSSSSSSPSLWPRLLNMIQLLEDLLHIHQAVEMRQDNSIQLFDDFFKTYTSVLRKNNVYDTLHIEKTYCQQIVSFRNINNIIDNGLLTGIAVSLIVSHSNPNP